MINKPLVSLIKVEVLGSNPTIVIGGMSYGAGPYKWPIIMGKWGEITVFIGVLSYNYINPTSNDHMGPPCSESPLTQFLVTS